MAQARKTFKNKYGQEDWLFMRKGVTEFQLLLPMGVVGCKGQQILSQGNSEALSFRFL